MQALAHHIPPVWTFIILIWLIYCHQSDDTVYNYTWSDHLIFPTREHKLCSTDSENVDAYRHIHINYKTHYKHIRIGRDGDGAMKNVNLQPLQQWIISIQKIERSVHIEITRSRLKNVLIVAIQFISICTLSSLVKRFWCVNCVESEIAI